MKATAVEKILKQISEEAAYATVKINADGESFIMMTKSGNDKYQVSVEDNILFIDNSAGSYWIDCDSISSILYQ